MTPAHWARAQAALVDERAALIVEHPIHGDQAFKPELWWPSHPGGRPSRWTARVGLRSRVVRRATDDQAPLRPRTRGVALRVAPPGAGEDERQPLDCAIDH
jgi:hypothetical protein